MGKTSDTRGFLDRRLVARIPVQGCAVMVSPTEVDQDPWVWSYLTACLATLVGLDEAREVVILARLEGGER